MEMTNTTGRQPNILITGGSGFLGRRIIAELLTGDSPLKPGVVRVFDLKPYDGKYTDRVEYVRGDIQNKVQLKSAFKDIDIVIHSAAIIDWGTKPKSEVLDVNVGGTENIIRACHENNVKYLVYTSSLDAVFTGKPLVNIDESQPYPKSHPTIYCESKKLAETAVTGANNEKLKTVVLRPADIYGEGDPYHIGSLIDMAEGGFYVRLGNGTAVCQHVYVGNMAHAHIMAAYALWTGNEKVHGEIYFITDSVRANFFKFYDRIVESSGYKIFPKNLWLPRSPALFIGAVSEAIAVLLRPVKKYNPKFSRFAVTYTCTDFTFTSSKAEKDFGYKQKYSLETALENTIGYYRKKKQNERPV